MMNYQEYRKFKESIKDQSSLLRLDCMNPFKAMNFMKKVNSTTSPIPESDVLDLWADKMRVQSLRSVALASHGVRESLKALFKYFALQKKELWLPDDTYPFYWDAALNSNLRPHGFSTSNAMNLTTLDQASANSVVVITNPVSPLGRRLNNKEINQIKDWLAGSPDRQIVIDTVYDYTSHFDALTLELFETGQCFIAHSLSKAWLERGIFGVLLTPKKERDTCANLLESPNSEACSSAFNAMEQCPDLPIQQQTAFSREWQRLLPKIQTLAPDFTSPVSGYFSVAKINHEVALNDFNTLVIPASVFGSRDSELSVITCLYDIAKNDH